MKTFREYLEGRDDELYNEISMKGVLPALAGGLLGMFGTGGAAHGQAPSEDPFSAIRKPSSSRQQIEKMSAEVDDIVKNHEDAKKLYDNLKSGKLNDFISKAKTTPQEKELMKLLAKVVAFNPSPMSRILEDQKSGPLVDLIHSIFPEFKGIPKDELPGIVYDLEKSGGRFWRLEQFLKKAGLDK
jgi:hypothetical protein